MSPTPVNSTALHRSKLAQIPPNRPKLPSLIGFSVRKPGFESRYRCLKVPANRTLSGHVFPEMSPEKVISDASEVFAVASEVFAVRDKQSEAHRIAWGAGLEIPNPEGWAGM